MNLADRLLVTLLASHIRRGDVAHARHVFDEKYADQSEEWRRDIWRQAAERAQGKVSR